MAKLAGSYLPAENDTIPSTVTSGTGQQSEFQQKDERFYSQGNPVVSLVEITSSASGS